MSKVILAATFSGVLAMFTLTPVAKADHCCCDSGYSLRIYSAPIRSYGIQPYRTVPYTSYYRVPSYYYSVRPRPYYYGYPSIYGYPYYGYPYYGSRFGYYGSGIGIGIGIGGHSYLHHGHHGHFGHH